MTEVPDALVEKSARVLHQRTGHPLATTRGHARAVLAVVWEAQVGLLCGQCGEQPAAMVKVGTHDGWCVTCLDEAAEPAVQPTVDRDKCWRHDYGHHEYVCTCRPAMPAGTHAALTNALMNANNTMRGETAALYADALLASGVLTDAAQVRADERRKVAERVRKELLRGGQTPALNLRAALRVLDDVAREAAAATDGDQR